MKILLILVMTIISSCSSYHGVNRVGESELSINGGLNGKLEWTDSLVFNRRSFYIEATLMHDILVSKVDTSSPFYQWFGSLPDNCNPAYILIEYTKESAILSQALINKQFEDNGFEIIIVPRFANHLKSNATFQRRNLGFYDVKALCPKLANAAKDKIIFNLPGYKETILDL